MSAIEVERFLARLYVSAEDRELFLRDPARALDGAGLDETERQALKALDRAGLELAAESFARKRRRADPP